METQEKFLKFQETELSHISGETPKAPKAKTSYVSPEEVMNKFF